MSKPLLSIGIIFKNDIRCIERCLKALEPLRKAVPSELVMADTGSTDGSREIAERYADILFDFPWVNDFSAARNAVMDRCSGKWYFSVDTDEYLDEDFSELLQVLRNGTQLDVYYITVRSYFSYEMDGPYGDVTLPRVLRMSTGLRYVGAIHERWIYDSRIRVYPQSRTVLHHDGYVGLSGPAGKAKRERNVKLIREELSRDPENLLRLLQFIESAGEEPDFIMELRRAISLIEEKRPGSSWEDIGPSIFRYGVIEARERGLPELERWIQEAEELFPESPFTRLDVEFSAFLYYWDRKKYSECIRRGERWLKAIEDFRAGRTDPVALTYGAVTTAAANWEPNLKIQLADTYMTVNQPEKAFALLEGVDCEFVDGMRAAALCQVLHEIQFKTSLNTEGLLAKLWKDLTAPKPNQEWADARRAKFCTQGKVAFKLESRNSEAQANDFCRHAYTLFLPLRDECELGRAAAVLETESVSEIERLLGAVKSWNEFPVQALTYALSKGVRFPVAGKPMNIEDMDVLAIQMAQEGDEFFPMVLKLEGREPEGDWPQLTWDRGLAIAAVQAYDWKDGDRGLALARIFVRMEAAFIPQCYNAAALEGDNIRSLPSMHRFGWYCVQAFDALGAGDTVSYVRLLREGLSICESMKPMVEFLLDHTPELQAVPAPTDELKALAEQIRAVLARFAPDDPMVAALKQSEAYQKVAYLIEGTEPPIMGGQMQ